MQRKIGGIYHEKNFENIFTLDIKRLCPLHVHSAGGRARVYKIPWVRGCYTCISYTGIDLACFRYWWTGPLKRRLPYFLATLKVVTKLN